MVKRIVHWCFICGRQKLSANHWFMAFLDRRMDLKLIRKWRESKACEPHTITICGEQCAHTLLSRWLSGDIREAKSLQEGTLDATCATRQ